SARFLLEPIEVESSRWLMGDHRIRHAFHANERRQSPGVETAHPDHAACPQPIAELARCAVARGRSDAGMKNDATRRRRGSQVHGLDVLFVGSDVPDMWKGERDDLTGIGRIGEDFLVPGHRGVEAYLAYRMAARPETEPFQHRSVREREDRGSLRLE